MAFARHNTANANRGCSRTIEAASATWDPPRHKSTKAPKNQSWPSGRALHPVYLHNHKIQNAAPPTTTSLEPACTRQPAKPPNPPLNVWPQAKDSVLDGSCLPWVHRALGCGSTAGGVEAYGKWAPRMHLRLAQKQRGSHGNLHHVLTEIP